MPGIVGLITQMPPEEAELQLHQMVQVLCHEDFYVEGTWTDESLGVYVGWVARRGSFSDSMPLRNEQGNVVLVFSGEEYPAPGTIQRLKERSHDFDEAGASYLVHAYEEDLAFPAALNGRFHGLLVDRNQDTAVLFNDRYSMHRIYYHETPKAFYFAAEAKAILAVRPEVRKMNPRAVGEFIACGCVLENRTLFEGIHALPGGSKWVFRNRRLAKKDRYFEPEEWENQESLEVESYYRELRDVFSRNLPRYFQARERIGMSLTGGLDSRMVLAWQRPQPGSLPCYTYGGMIRECRDVIVARQAAHATGQSHEVIHLATEFLTQFPRYAERAVYLTDGCVDVSLAPDLYFHEKAREIAPIRMTGLYGGEVLRGVRSFKPEKLTPYLFAPEILAYIGEAKETYAQLVQAHPVSFSVFKQAPWHQYGILALEQTQVTVRSPFLDNDLVRTTFQAPQSTLAAKDLSVRLISDGDEALLRIPTDRGLDAARGSFSGVVSRAFLEFSFKAEYAYDIGMPQWVARIDHVLSPLRFERFFLGKHKVSHFRSWYRDILADYVREILLDPRSLSRSYVEPKGTRVVVEGHISGKRNYTTELHKLLTLELCHAVLLDAGSYGASAGRHSMAGTRI
jgi:asparagine synthase (glutamine-hydrolysing)